jgi:hypothetical protein
VKLAEGKKQQTNGKTLDTSKMITLWTENKMKKEYE